MVLTHFYCCSNGIFNGSKVTTKEIKIWLDNVDCIGDEAILAHCPNAGWGIEDCSRGENVKIECNNKTDGTCIDVLLIIYNIRNTGISLSSK